MQKITISNLAEDLLVTQFLSIPFNYKYEKYLLILSVIVSDLYAKSELDQEDTFAAISNSINQLLVDSRRHYNKEIPYTALTNHTYCMLTFRQYLVPALESVGYLPEIIITQDTAVNLGAIANLMSNTEFKEFTGLSVSQE